MHDDIDNAIDLTLERDFINPSKILDTSILSRKFEEFRKESEKEKQELQTLVNIGDRNAIKNYLFDSYKDEAIVDYIIAEMFNEKVNYCIRCGKKMFAGINAGLYDICIKCEQEIEEGLGE